jgi:hypothetical protein
MSRTTLCWLSLAALLASGCAVNSPAVHTWERTELEGAADCEEPSADQCVVLACEQGECGVFSCEDVDPDALAHVGGGYELELARGFRAPLRGSGPHRNWRSAGLRDGARPRMTFHFRYRCAFTKDRAVGCGMRHGGNSGKRIAIVK